MRIPIAVLGVAVLCAGSSVNAQTTPPDLSHQGSSTATSDELRQQAPIEGVQILSDTEGLDFGQYLRQWRRITEATWEPLISKDVNPPILGSDVVAIRLKVLPNGRLMDGSLVLEGRSGDVALDRAAWDAIARSDYPSLPEEFHGPYLELRANFVYKNHLAKQGN
jgi:hypothetical protein